MKVRFEGEFYQMTHLSLSHFIIHVRNGSILVAWNRSKVCHAWLERSIEPWNRSPKLQIRSPSFGTDPWQQVFVSFMFCWWSK